MRGEGRAQTIQATALVHEVYIRLFGNVAINGTIARASTEWRRRQCGAFW